MSDDLSALLDLLRRVEFPMRKVAERSAFDAAIRAVEETRFAASESAIENFFAAAICCIRPLLDVWPAEQFDGACERLVERKITTQAGMTVCIEDAFIATSQYQIGDTRVDFVFAIRNWRSGKVCKLVVECDGHAFHERTKEQAARDRARDRALQEKEWGIFRFTGSEIWKDPLKCAEQVADYLDHKACEKP